MERKNWQQEIRKRTLMEIADLMNEHGGYSAILTSGSMPDFEKYVSLKIGCSLRQTKEYLETLRGAALFYQRTKNKG